MKKLLCIALAALLLLPFAACGKKETADDATDQCTVTFQNTGLNAQKVEKGTALTKPADPEKKDHIFGGWYLDAALTEAASFPLTVNGDTTLYARFYDYATAFAAAREKTIGSGVAGFEYDYTTDLRASYSALSLTGKTTGNAKYSTAGEVSFYDAHTNSGLLLNDGYGYQIKRGDLLQKITLDENELLTKYEAETVSADRRFDASSFAKALFEYDASQLKSISKTNKANEYQLKTSFNASAGIALVSKVLNNATVQKLIGEVPDNSVNTGMYVTFAGGEVQSYRYEMQISVTALTFSLTYTLTFKNTGTAKTITPRTFEGLSLTAAEIAATRTEIGNIVSAFENKTASGYDFNVKTKVDLPSANGTIDATFDGSAKRRTESGTVYFHNDIEIDSDYKNTDLYKAAGIADVHVKRTRLANGDVYNIEKKLIDTTTQVTPYTADRNDSYYLFDLFAAIRSCTFVQKTAKNGVTTYSLGVTNAEVAAMLTYLNGALDLDPLGKATASPKVFGNFAASAVTADEAKVVLTVQNGALVSLKIEAEGNFRTSFDGSQKYTAAQNGTYGFTYTLTVRSDGDAFVPYQTVKDAK